MLTQEDIANGACPRRQDGHTESWWDGAACAACGASGEDVVSVTDKEPTGDAPPREGD